MAVQSTPLVLKDRFGNVIAQNLPSQASGQLDSFIQGLVSQGHDLGGATLSGGPYQNAAYPIPLSSVVKNIPSYTPPNGPDVAPPAGGGGAGGTPTTPNGPISPVDPNQPLSTPGTPVNQGTAPSDINSFIPATSTQQQNIVNQALDQSRNTATQNVGDLTDLFHKNILAQVSNWTDPNSPDYQSTMGQLNNVGRADPSTFGQSISSRLAPLISNSLTQTAQGALLPSFLTQQGLIGTGAANQSNIGLASLQRFMQQADFQKQSDLANQLAEKGVPSNFQQGVGGASSFLQGLGNFGQGAAGLKSLTNTWICTHLKKLKLATEEEVDAVHERLCPTLVRHPIHWLHYLLSGPRLIALADAGGADWGAVKQVLIDAVIAEPDSEKAFLIYRDGCKRLCERYAPELWKLEAMA